MASDRKKLKVEYRTDHPDGKPRWVVIQVIGSIGFHPGQILEEQMMKDLCHQTGIWEVTIVGKVG
jgi:hypothetical protein